MEPSLHLSPTAHVCVLDESVVFLDLAGNTYITVPPQAISALTAAVAGFSSLPLARTTTVSTSDANDQDDVVEALVRRRVLVPANLPGKAAAAPTLNTPTRALAPGLRGTFGVRRSALLLPLLRSYVPVAAHLRRGRLAYIVSVLHDMKRGITDSLNDIGAIDGLLTSFREIRAFIYTAHGECLLNSLVLTRLLLTLRFTPLFVIGVRTKPFCAHAWVQVGDVVVDDCPEFVQRFTPILAI